MCDDGLQELDRRKEFKEELVGFCQAEYEKFRPVAVELRCSG